MNIITTRLSDDELPLAQTHAAVPPIPQKHTRSLACETFPLKCLFCP